MLLDFFIAPAFAQTAPLSGKGLLEAFWPLLVMVPLFYLLMIRPQMKRQKESRQMIESLAKGDEVILTGGIAGRIVHLGEVYLSVDIADGTVIKAQRTAIASVLPKGTLKAL